MGIQEKGYSGSSPLASAARRPAPAALGRALGRALAAAFLLAAASAAAAGEADPPFALWLPAQALAVWQAADPQAEAAHFGETLFGKLAQTEAMAPFLADLARSRAEIAGRMAAEAGVDPAVAAAFLDAPVSAALLDLDLSLQAETASDRMVAAFRLRLPAPLDHAVLFEALARQINTPGNLAQAASLLGRQVPTLAYVENWPTAGGEVPVLKTLGAVPWHVALRGPHVLAYRGPSDGPLRAMLDRSFAAQAGAVPADSLQADRGYQAAWRGAEARPGGQFLYANLRRAQPALAALAGSPAAAIWSCLGLETAQDLGLSGAWTGPGLRHVLYLHAPGARSGLLAALSSRPGAEGIVARLPAAGGGALAIHADMSVLLEEVPLLVDAVSRALSGREGAFAGAADPWTGPALLGAPARDLVAALGGDLVWLPGPDGAVLRFDGADPAAFGALVARMEREGGARFRERPSAGGLSVRYLRSSRGGLAPGVAYCLAPTRPGPGGARATLLMAAHPQALLAQLEPAGPAAPIGGGPDFTVLMGNMRGGWDMFACVDCRQSFVRLYNGLLPAMNLWTDPSRAGWLPGAGARAPGGGGGAGLPMLYAWSYSPLLGADPGLLPPGSALGPHLFGLGLGVKTDAQGVTAMAYSPLGFWGLAAWAADKLALQNPAAAASLAAGWMGR